MASEDLLKKAVAAFNALSPDQQAEMLEEQRQSWVRGNIGLSRDERGMTSPVMPRPAPADTDTGLVTVGHMVSHDAELGPVEDAVVYRSQAVELLASERAEKEIAERANERCLKETSKLRADNAAKDARIKELEAALDSDPDGSGLWRFWSKKSVEAHQQLRDKTKTIKALEAKLETYHEEYENRKEGYEKTINSLEEKLAAAEKALEFYRDGFKYHPKRTSTGINISEWKPTPELLDDCGETARAALGGKP